MTDAPTQPTAKLSPIVKWAGGKEQELKYILPNIPSVIENYYEPFVGGGAVYMAIEANRYFINDRSEELTSLYKSVCGQYRALFFKAVDETVHHWDQLTDLVTMNNDFLLESYKAYSNGKVNEDAIRQTLSDFITRRADTFSGMFSGIFNFNAPNFLKELQINLLRKVKRMKQLEHSKHLLPDKDIADNMETALKSAFYMHFRHLLNNMAAYKLSVPVRSAVFLFIRNFAYSGMFRYNASGEFNVPYGGIGYNRKNLRKKVDYLKSKPLQNRLGATTIENLDFETFLQKYRPGTNDFIFLDPPYDSEFSTYAQNEFTRDDQARLARFLINDCRAHWMLLIKNTELMRQLYFDKGLNIKTFDKTYLVSFMNRNDKNAEHLLITNY